MWDFGVGAGTDLIHEEHPGPGVDPHAHHGAHGRVHPCATPPSLSPPPDPCQPPATSPKLSSPSPPAATPLGTPQTRPPSVPPRLPPCSCHPLGYFCPGDLWWQRLTRVINTGRGGGGTLRGGPGTLPCPSAPRAWDPRKNPKFADESLEFWAIPIVLARCQNAASVPLGVSLPRILSPLFPSGIAQPPPGSARPQNAPKVIPKTPIQGKP